MLRDGKEVELSVQYNRQPRIMGLPTDGAAIAAGFQPGDVFIEIQGTRVSTVEDVILTIASLPPNEEVSVLFERAGIERTIAFTPDVRTRTHPVTKEETPIPFFGVELNALDGLQQITEPVTLSEALRGSAYAVWKIPRDSAIYIGRILFDDATTDHLSGPIGIAKFSAKAAERGPVDLIHMIALISTAIGFLNLFPIPVLDGGHLVFYFVEWIRGKPINEAIVRYGSAAGLSLLLLLMVFVTFNNDLGLGAWFTQD